MMCGNQRGLFVDKLLPDIVFIDVAGIHDANGGGVNADELIVPAMPTSLLGLGSVDGN